MHIEGILFLLCAYFVLSKVRRYAMTAFTRTVLWALLAAVVTAAVLIFIFALWAYNSDDPSSLVGIMGTAAFLLSCLAGGAVSRRGDTNILNSLAFAVLFILICFALSLVFNSERRIGTVVLTYLAGFASALIGGMIFAGKRTKKPKTLKKYKKLRLR